MFSLSFAVLILIIFGVNGQASDAIGVGLAKIEKSYPFGKLRLSADGKNEELIASGDNVIPSIVQSQSLNDQPLPSPCTGVRSLQKLAFPKDQTKYILCRDEFHYEILTCPNGGEFNEKLSSCEVALPLPIPLIDRCEQEKPCLYGGQCTLLSNSSFLCTCTPGWTGSRCETPLNSCSKKPCGPSGECNIIKTTDYEKDYVCICNERSTYGLNCQDVMPNPCLTIHNEFFPYAFSQHAFIQCDGDIMFVQPCGSLLYWNQDDKNCDRKRPKKIDFQKLLAKLSLPIKNDYQQEIEQEIVKLEIFSTTVAPSEQQSAYIQKGREISRNFLGFAPARIVSRQQVQMDMDNQQSVPTQNAREIELKTQEPIIPLSQYGDSNQMRQDLVSKPQQWPNQLSETVVRQPVIIQSARNQLSAQNTFLTPQQKVVSTPTLAMTREPNTDQLQMRQNNQQQSQAFDNQQWLNQAPEMKMLNDQRFVSPTPSREDSQPLSYQEELESRFPVATALDTTNRFSTNMQQNGQLGVDQQIARNRQLTKNSANSEVRQNFAQFETAPVDVQRSALNKDHRFVIQSAKTEQQPLTLNLKVSSDLNEGQFPRGGQSQVKQDDQPPQDFLPQTQQFGTQQWLNQIPNVKGQSSQRFHTLQQPRQVSQTDQKQPIFFAEIPTTAQRMTNTQGLQNSQNQEQSWQTQLTPQPVQSPPIKTQYQKFNTQPLMTDSFTQTENTQYGLNQQQKILPTQNSYEQKQSWSYSQPFQTQESQITDADVFEPLPTQSFNTRPITPSKTQSRVAAGQFTPNLVKVQNSYDWQPSRAVEQPQDNIHVVQTAEDYRTNPSWTVARS